MSVKSNKQRKMRKWHKWGGLIFAFFFIMFAASGIFLNHRQAISEIDIPRSFLSSDYEYNNWNNGAVKGSFRLSSDSILYYGGIGLLATDSLCIQFSYFDKGIKEGTDNRIVGNIVKVDNGDIYAITTFDLYRLNRDQNKWINQSELLDTDERICDLQVVGDSLIILTRSHLFVSQFPYNQFNKIDLKAPVNYKKEVSLFKTMWMLHSGELFGITGKLLVDLLGIVSILLCLTGLIFTLFPKIIKKKKRNGEQAKSYSSIWKSAIKIHNKLGSTLLVFLLILILSGMFLRPPLLISIIKTKTATLPGTTLNSDNPWLDKLRCIRYNSFDNKWILYSSEGFYYFNTLDSEPRKIETPPPVSVMGVTVLEQQDSVNWLVGSFSGLYYWNSQTGKSIDAYTLQPAIAQRAGPPVITNAVSGYSNDYKEKEIVFGYDKGARGLQSGSDFVSMPDNLKNNANMSLWHLCLEIHTGRIYNPVLGIFSDLFIFLSGLLLLSIIISGYVVYRVRYKKKPIQKRNNKEEFKNRKS